MKYIENLKDALQGSTLGNESIDFVLRAVNSHEALIEVQTRAEELADVVRNGGNYRQAVEWFDEANKAYVATAQAEGK